VARDINDIPPELWDSLAARFNLQATHRFIRCCQEAAVPGTSFRHVLAYDNGRLAAVASLCCMDVRLELMSAGATRAAIRGLRRLLPGFLQVPVVFCGLPVSFGQPCLVLRPGVPAGAVLGALSRLAEDLARRCGAPIVCFKEFKAPQAADLDALTTLGFFRAPSLPGCVLPLRWASFEEYLADLRAGYRRQVLATLRRRQAGGLKVRVRDGIGGDIDTVVALYEQVMDRAPHQLERLDRRFFEALDRRLAGEVRTIVLQHRDRPVGCAVVLVTPEGATFLLAGLDYAANRAHHVYHNLALEVVAEAIRCAAAGRGSAAGGGSVLIPGAEGAVHGLLEMGQTSYELKSRLGAQASGRVMYLRHRGRLGQVLLRRFSRWLFPVASCPARRVFKSPEPVTDDGRPVVQGALQAPR
jgi:hypothetical protein